jgi:hypothetical protein
MRIILLNHVMGNELILIGQDTEKYKKYNGKEYNKVERSRNILPISNILRNICKHKNISKKLIIKVITKQDIIDQFLVNDLGLIIADNSKLIINQSNIAYFYINNESKIYSFTGHQLLNINSLVGDKNILSKLEIEKDRDKTIKNYIYRDLKNINEVIMIHETAYDKNKEDFITRNNEIAELEKEILFPNISNITAPKVSKQNQLLKQIAKEMNSEIEEHISPDNIIINSIHYETNIFDKYFDSKSNIKSIVVLERIFQNVEVSHIIPSIYFVSIRNPHHNKLKLYEVNQDGVTEPYLNIMEILTYKRKLTYYPELINYIEKQKEDFIWMKLNLTQNDKTTYFNDFLANIFLYKNGHIDIIISKPNKLNGYILQPKEGEQTYIDKIRQILNDILIPKMEMYFLFEDNENKIKINQNIDGEHEHKFSESESENEEDNNIYIPSTNDLFEDFSILNIKAKIIVNVDTEVRKSKLKKVIDFFGSRLRELEDTEKYNYYSLNMKIGDIISNTPYEFLILLEELYTSYYIHNNPQNWAQAISKYYPDEIDARKNITTFIEELCDDIHHEQAITMGPVIDILKGNVKALQFQIHNIRSLKSYFNVLKLLNIFIDIYIKNKFNSIVREGNVNIGINNESGDIINEDELINDIDEQHDFQDSLDEEDNQLMIEDEADRSQKSSGLMMDDGSETPKANAGAGAGGVEENTYQIKEKTKKPEEIVYDPNYIASNQYIINRIKERAFELFNQEKMNYTRKCPKQHERQPIILNQNEFDNIIKNYAGAFGFKKKLDSGKKITVEDLRSDKLTDEEKREAMEEFFVFTYVNKEKQYYICPKYWCIVENRPMTAEEIKNGECGGKLIDKRLTKKENKGRYIYVRDSDYFSVKKDKDGFISFGDDVNILPRFTKTFQFQKDGLNLSLPCCFIKKNSNLTKTSLKKGVKNQNHYMFRSIYETLANRNENKEVNNSLIVPPRYSFINNQNDNITFNDYVLKNEKYNLKNGQISILPYRMANFIFHEKKCLSNSNTLSKTIPGCMFRKGIHYNDMVLGIFYDIRKSTQTNDITIRNETFKKFKELVHKSYTFEKFITYCKGTLPDIFYDESIETNITTRFSKNDKDILEKIIRAYPKNEQREQMRKYILSYDMFKKYILDNTETKNIDYFLEFMQDENTVKNRNGEYVNILSGLEGHVNVLIFEIKLSGKQTNIMMRCPYFGNINYEDGMDNVLIYKYKNKYQPILYRTHEFNDVYLINIDTLTEYMNENIEDKTVKKTHMANLLQSLKFSIDNYKRQCAPKVEDNLTMIDYLLLDEESKLPFELLSVYIGKDNHIHGLKLVNITHKKITKNSIFSITVPNIPLDEDILNDNEIDILNIENMPLQNVNHLLKNLKTVKKNNIMFRHIGFSKYVIENDNLNGKIVGIMLQNKTITPIQPFVDKNNIIKENEIYQKLNVEDYLNIIYKIEDIETDNIYNQQKHMRLLIEKIFMHLSQRKNLQRILNTNRILNYRNYLEQYFETVINYLDNHFERKISRPIPHAILKKSDKEILENHSNLFYSKKTNKFRLYRFFSGNRETILQIISEILLNYLYKNPEIRRMIKNSTYQFNYGIDNFNNALILTEVQLQDLINQDLKRIDNKYIQREFHYENMNVQGLKNNVIESFFGNILEAKPFNSDGGNKGANWSQLLPNTITIVEKRNEFDAWKAFAFGLKLNTDIDDLKTEYIQHLVNYLMENDNNKEEFLQFINESKQVKNSLFNSLILDDEEEIKDTLEMIIMSNSYFISEMDIKLFVKFYNKDVIILRDNIISKKSTNNFNFADHYISKNNNPERETLFMISYNIPLNPYKSYSNILFFDENENDNEKKYKPIIKFNEYLLKNQIWQKNYEKWTKGRRKEINVITI